MKHTVRVLGLAAALVVLAGCTHTGSQQTGPDGGLFKSISQGESWTQNVNVKATEGAIVTFVNENVRPIVLDPQDHNAVYIGTGAAGLLYSYDGGLSWEQDQVLGNVGITSLAIDYFDKCKWVVATPKKIYRTLDCGRGWREMLSETREGYDFKTVLTDHFNQNVLYALNTKEILKSNDYGETWRTVYRTEGEFVELLMDANDSRILYGATWGNGLVKTLNGGADWESLAQAMREYRSSLRVRKIVQDVTQENTYIIASVYGLLKTTDGGVTWTPFELITPPDAVNIWSLAVHPTNPNVILYATDTTLYKTIDGGINWKTIKLPSSRRPTWLTFDFKDGNVVYLGTRKADN